MTVERSTRGLLTNITRRLTPLECLSCGSGSPITSYFGDSLQTP